MLEWPWWLPEPVLMSFLREASLDNVLDRAVFWLNWGTMDYEIACFTFNEI